jgi:hypothetical protein
MGILKRKEIPAWEKTYRALWRREERFLRRYEKKTPTAIEAKIGELAPDAIMETLHTAFIKAFGVVFEKGTGPILKAAGVDKRRIDYEVNLLAVDEGEDKKTLKAFSKAAHRSGKGNVLLSGAAGMGMGAFGVMLPDVPLFTAMLLKTVYETAESYGYRTEEEQIFALRVINAALTDGAKLRKKDAWINEYIQTGCWSDEPDLKREMNAAARSLSRAVLYSKVVQNVPVVGAVGGVGDAVVMHRVQKYAAIKYEKRFLIERKMGR